MNEAHIKNGQLEKHTRLCLFFLCYGSCLVWHFKNWTSYKLSVVVLTFINKRWKIWILG